MRIVKNMVIGLAILLLLVVIGGYAYLYLAFPRAQSPAKITIERTPERVARGEYLTAHVLGCMDCHSERQHKFFSAPPKPESYGKGGELVHDEPGKVPASNITPAALKDWTDGEIIRAITEGVSRDGRPLVPMMPYSEYRYLSTKDVKAVVAYLRTLKPIENNVALPEVKFPLNLIFRTLPGPAAPMPDPPEDDPVARGEYLVQVAGCAFCHSPVEKGQPIKGLRLAGGHAFGVGKDLTLYSANLTPDPETGIGNWSEEMFLGRFQVYRDSAMQKIPVTDENPQTVMPWVMDAGIKDEDLRAIYAYLKSLKPIRHKVQKYQLVKE